MRTSVCRIILCLQVTCCRKTDENNGTLVLMLGFMIYVVLVALAIHNAAVLLEDDGEEAEEPEEVEEAGPMFCRFYRAN